MSKRKELVKIAKEIRHLKDQLKIARKSRLRFGEGFDFVGKRLGKMPNARTLQKLLESGTEFYAQVGLPDIRYQDEDLGYWAILQMFKDGNGEIHLLQEAGVNANHPSYTLFGFVDNYASLDLSELSIEDKVEYLIKEMSTKEPFEKAKNLKWESEYWQEAG